MMKRRTRLVLSGICGVLSVVMAVAYADSARAEVENARTQVLERYGGEVASLVVARHELKAGSVLSESDLEVREWLVDLAPEQALISLEDAVGQRITSNMAAGTPLSKVSFAGEDGVLAVPDGKVAITVRPTDKTGVTADLAQGTRLIAYEIDKQGESKLISSDISVLSGGAGAVRDSASAVLVLACAPSDVAQILSASAASTLRLVIPADGVDVTKSQPTTNKNTSTKDAVTAVSPSKESPRHVLPKTDMSSHESNKEDEE